jgi:serine/threonine protein kinase
MEYLKGQTLLEVLTNRRGPLPEAEAVAYVVKVAEALEAIHNAGLIHRDIKPDNIIVTETGRVVLIDFGSTRKYAASEMGIMTALIAPGYSPLEQYSRKSEFFAPTLDIYALGATLYHLLTNARPEDATDRVNADALRQPISLNPNISRKTNDSIMRAMKMDPKARFQSARQFVNALQGTPGIVSLPGPQLPIPFPSRQPFPIPLWKKVLPVVLIIFAIAFIAFGPYIKSSPPPYQKPVQKPGQTSGSDVKPPDVPPPTPSPSDPVINQKFDVPIRPQNVKSGSYTYNPNTCSVTISGPTSKVSLIKQDNIHLFVDLNEHGGNSDTYTVQLSLDPGIDRSSVSYDPRTTKVNKKQPKPPPPPPSHTPPKPPPPP